MHPINHCRCGARVAAPPSTWTGGHKNNKNKDLRLWRTMSFLFKLTIAFCYGCNPFPVRQQTDALLEGRKIFWVSDYHVQLGNHHGGVHKQWVGTHPPSNNATTVQMPNGTKMYCKAVLFQEQQMTKSESTLPVLTDSFKK